jgi:hypothetical protein
MDDGVLAQIERGAPQQILEVVRALRRGNAVEAAGYVSHEGVGQLQTEAQTEMWRLSTPETVSFALSETWQYDDLFTDLMRRRALKKANQHLWMITILRAWLAHTLRMRAERLFSARITTVRRSKYLWWMHTASNIKKIMVLLLSPTFSVRMPRAPVFAFWRHQTRILTAIYHREISCMRRCWVSWKGLLLWRKALYFRYWVMYVARLKAIRRTTQELFIRQQFLAFRLWWVQIRLAQIKRAREVRTRRDNFRAMRRYVAAAILFLRTLKRRQFTRWREQASFKRKCRRALTRAVDEWRLCYLRCASRIWKAVVRWKRRVVRNFDRAIWLEV